MDEEGCYPFVVGNSRFLTGLSARFGMTILYLSFKDLTFNFFEGVGLGDIKFGYGGTA